MEKFVSDYHGIEALAILLAINVLTMVGKYLFKLFDKKNDKTEKNQKDTDERIQDISERLERIDESTKHLYRSVESFQNVLSSYMETTISFSSKLGASEKQFSVFSEHLNEVQEQVEKVARYDDDLRRLMHAIKWLAGPERWRELKDTILKDDYR